MIRLLADHGRWTSCPTRSTGAGGFACWRLVDDFTREALALVVDTSISGTRVARELDALMASRGRPTTIVSDNGTEEPEMVPQGTREPAGTGSAGYCTVRTSELPPAQPATSSSKFGRDVAIPSHVQCS